MKYNLFALLKNQEKTKTKLNFTEESYIDDIPFSTTEVYNEIFTEQQLVQFDFEESSLEYGSIVIICPILSSKFKRPIYNANINA